MRIERWTIAALLALFALLAVAASTGKPWNAEQLAQLQQLSLASLPPLPADPSNRVADDERAAELGQRLFFDQRLSANGKVACATCHLPDKQFQDGTPLAQGVGTTDRRTMSIIGTARSPWQFWDGRKDSQWAQALGPLESAVEHGGDRTQYVHLLAANYRAEYEAIFEPCPTCVACRSTPARSRTRKRMPPGAPCRKPNATRSAACSPTWARRSRPTSGASNPGRPASTPTWKRPWPATARRCRPRCHATRWPA
ncbi:cytochrome-c peroxidase [Ramlibacter montanisoli]|uniref:cytochrome-c peroxidase n=1 Tax=Ramlibacter montanisoli TaxID=2732512 RepID=UPI001C0E8FFC|nr:cytochrome-c peroxidase [Ramlibacter montanisoli]